MKMFFYVVMSFFIFSLPTFAYHHEQKTEQITEEISEGTSYEGDKQPASVDEEEEKKKKLEQEAENLEGQEIQEKTQEQMGY